MGGTILPFLDTLESSLSFYAAHGLTHIVAPSLTASQRDRIARTLNDPSVAIRSSTWLYTCIDSRSCISLAAADVWQASLFLPAPRSLRFLSPNVVRSFPRCGAASSASPALRPRPSRRARS